MARIGLDSSRTELPGSPGLIVVSVRWAQRAFNAWRAATSSTLGALAEDGVWGPNTESALRAVVSEIDPGTLATMMPSGDRRAVVLSRKIENVLAQLEAVSSSSTMPRASAPIVDFTTSDPGAGSSMVLSAATPTWVYVLAGVSFVAATGITYAALNTK